MSLADEIQSAQIRAGEAAVMRNLERLGLAPAAPEMVAVTKEDANNYCRVLANLGIEDEATDPVDVIEMLRSWETDAQARAELLEKHLRNVLEVARTWQPDYATKMDRDTLQYAQDCADYKTPNGGSEPTERR